MNLLRWLAGIPFHLRGDRKREWNRKLLVSARTGRLAEVTEPAEQTLNQRIEEAWLQYREAGRDLTGKDKRDFQVRFVHLAADNLSTTLDRVWQRVRKIERRDK